MAAAEAEQFEAAARLRDQLSTVHQLQEKQRIATAEQNDDADVFGYHFEDGSLAVNLFHMRGGKIVDRREFFWEDLPELLEASAAEARQRQQPGAPGLDAQTWEKRRAAISTPAQVFSALLKQLYIDQHYVPRTHSRPGRLRRSRSARRSPQRAHRPPRRNRRSPARREAFARRPRRTERKAVLHPALPRARALAQSHSGIARRRADASRTAPAHRVLRHLSHPGRRNRRLHGGVGRRQDEQVCVSQIQSDDRPRRRRFRLHARGGVPALPPPEGRRTSRMPSLMLIDGGLGQLHAAAEALEALGFTSQPLASIAKKEEVIYLYGNEDEPVVLDRRSPVLHLVQMIRDESHRFAVGYHRQRRAMRDRDSELLNIPGVGAQTRQRLLTHFGSLRDVQQATADSLASVVPRKTAESIWRHFHEQQRGKRRQSRPSAIPVVPQLATLCSRLYADQSSSSTSRTTGRRRRASPRCGDDATGSDA